MGIREQRGREVYRRREETVRDIVGFPRLPGKRKKYNKLRIIAYR